MSLLDKASLVVTPNAVKESKLYSVVPNTTLGDMDVVRATTATRVNSAGLIEVVPRNLLQQSNGFNVGPWVNSGVTLTSGFTDVNGGNKAFRFQCPATTSFIYNLASATTGAQYTHSVYVRAVSGTQTIKVEDAYAGGAVNTTVTTEWQRITLTFTATVNEVGILIYNNPSTAVDVYICFAQSEQGSTATEYFPTTTRLNIPRIDYTNGSCPSLLVEPQRTNIALYSEQFDNAAWVKGSTAGTITVTANNTTSPDGTNSADRIVFPATSSGQYSVVAFPFNATAANYSGSFYFKGLNGNEIIWISYTKDGVNYSRTICNLTTSWQRFNLSALLTVGADYFQFGVDTRDGSQSPKGSQTIFAWGAQLEQGAYATSYVPTVATSVTRNADVISKTGISSLIGQTEGTIFIEESALSNSSNIRLLSISNDSTINIIRIGFDDSNRIIVQCFKNGSQIAYLVADGVSIINFNKVCFRYKDNDFSLWVNGVKKAELTTQLSWSGNNLNTLRNDQHNGDNKLEAKLKSIQIYKTYLTDTEIASLTTL